MKFRETVESDVNNVMAIIKQAQDYLKEQGIDQWQDNYPNAEIIRNDIINKEAYVLLDDDTLVGTVAVSFKGEKTYKSIHDGSWLSNEDYAVIHRIAVDSKRKGLGLSSIILKNIEELCLSKDVHSIKVDTHRENQSMQKWLYKNGFQYCGIIYLEDNSERVAFEKIL